MEYNTIFILKFRIDRDRRSWVERKRRLHSQPGTQPEKYYDYTSKCGRSD